MSTAQMKALACIQKPYYLKASEIFRFFLYIKAGDLGGFFGTIDPQKVGEYLNDFKKWRSLELDKVNNRKAQEEKERKRKEWKRTGITRQQYERRVKSKG